MNFIEGYFVNRLKGEKKKNSSNLTGSVDGEKTLKRTVLSVRFTCHILLLQFVRQLRPIDERKSLYIVN